MELEIKELLSSIIHPESGESIVESGVVEKIVVREKGITIYLAFTRRRDPFASKIKGMVEEAILESYGAEGYSVIVVIKEAEPAKPKVKTPTNATNRVGEAESYKIIAVASGKGGVGKSTLTASLAVTLRDMGYKVGLLDADIYGPSQHKIFGCEGFQPEMVVDGEREMITPAEVNGVKIISIGMFVGEDDALMWRGMMACSALKQFIEQTLWGDIDFLLVDLPPGTGDIHLSLVTEMKISGAVIVTTPQNIALADVRRGVEMLRNDKVAVPVLGLVENMSWFTPAELPDNRYYIFGEGGGRRYAKALDIEFLGEVPIIQGVMQCCDDGSLATTSPLTREYYIPIAARIIDKLNS
ncbi:MAG: Mrp/NBP35 family ATP-binding protein [Rikenellaceae bacterium]